MARPKAKAPARRYHLSGQSVVTIGGRDFYLGPHDSPESIARYAALVIYYQANGLTLPDDFDAASLDVQAATLLGQQSPQVAAADQAKQPKLVRHVTAAYRQHIAVKYAESPAEIHRLTGICDDIDKHDGSVEAVDYGPLRLQAQRQRWIDSGKARVYCNRLTNAVKRIWKNAVSQELVTPSCWEALRSVERVAVWPKHRAGNGTRIARQYRSRSQDGRTPFPGRQVDSAIRGWHQLFFTSWMAPIVLYIVYICGGRGRC